MLLRRFCLTLSTLLLSISLWGTIPVSAQSQARLNLTNYSSDFASLIGSQSVQEACKGVNLDTSNTSCPNSSSSIDSILSTVISILSVIVGIVAIIMIIVGGLKFITSGGEASKTAAARNTIIYALVGLVVAIAAQLIVHFVLNRAVNAVNTPGSSAQQAPPSKCEGGTCLQQ